MPRQYISLSPEQRFWSKVDRSVSPDSCWPWTAYRYPNGYGQFFWNKRFNITAHRAAWIIMYGPIPEGLWVLHHCDNRCCCNPHHLFLGTNADNIADKVAKNRQARGKQLQHRIFARGEQNGQAKFTDEIITLIRARHEAGESQRALAREFAVSPTTINKIIHRMHWRHV